MKIKIGGIIGGLVVLVIVIWFSLLSDTQYEIIEKETIHPCQQNAIDLITFQNGIKLGTKFSQSEASLINYEWRELTKKSDECAKYYYEWYTEEFEVKLETIHDQFK